MFIAVENNEDLPVGSRVGGGGQKFLGIRAAPSPQLISDPVSR